MIYILYQYWTWYKISVHFLLFVHVSIIISLRRLWAWIARSTCAWFKNVFHPTFFQYAIFFSQIKHLWSNTRVEKLVMIVHIFKLLRLQWIIHYYNLFILFEITFLTASRNWTKLWFKKPGELKFSSLRIHTNASTLSTSWKIVLGY